MRFRLADISEILGGAVNRAKAAIGRHSLVASAPTPYGFYHSPPEGSRGVLGGFSASDDKPVLIVVYSKQSHPQDIPSGDVGLNSIADEPDAPHRIHLSPDDKTIEILVNDIGITISPEGVFVLGDLEVDGDISATGDIIAGPPGARVSLTKHTHPTSAPGAPTSAPTKTA